MPEQPENLNPLPKAKNSLLKNPVFLVSLGLIVVAIAGISLFLLNKPTVKTPISTKNPIQKTAPGSAAPTTPPAAQTPTTVDITTLAIYQQMLSSDSQNYQSAVAKGVSFSVTSDNKSFWAYWKPQNWSTSSPKKLIISLGGHDGYASQDFAAKYPVLSANYPFALASLQWWFGKGEKTSDYYTPSEMNIVINDFLSKEGFTQNDLIVFEGFSRGSANSYAVAALNSTSKYFDFIISNAGGFANDYPPNKEVLNGKFGNAPYANYKWILYCGEKDPDPDSSGCPGMESTKTTIEKYGASVVLFIKDPKGTHGSFMTTTSNYKQALDLILK